VPKNENEKPPKTPIPNWENIDEIANELEKVFFEKSTERKLTPYDMSVIISRLNLLFDEYKIMLVVGHAEDRPNVDFKGSNIYK